MNTILQLKPLQPLPNITNPLPPLLLWRKKKTDHRIIPPPTRLCSSNGKGFGSNSITNNDDKVNDVEKKKRVGDDEDDEISPEVYDRIMRRIVVFVGSPMATGVGLLYVMSALKDNGIWDVPVWLPFVTTLVLFGTSAFGIAYGTLSSSWETEREGSFLGWEEARKNWPELWKEDDKEKKKKTTTP